MARFKRHRIDRRQQADGSWRCFREGGDQGEIFLVEVSARNADDEYLPFKDGNNAAMAVIARWLKHPSRVGEWFWKTAWRNDPLGGQLIVAFYFTQWTTAFEFKMAWA